MDDDITMIKLFKEPGSLTKDEAKHVARQFFECAKRMPELTINPLNLMAIRNVSDMMEGL